MKVQMKYFCASKAALQLLLELKSLIYNIEDEMRLKQRKQVANSRGNELG